MENRIMFHVVLRILLVHRATNSTKCMCAYSMHRLMYVYKRPCITSAEKTVTVFYPYEGKLNAELAMKPGDVIAVDNWTASDNWARGTLKGKTGLFYKPFVKPSSDIPSPNDCKLKKVRGKPTGYEVCYRGREYVLKEKLDEVECIICQELADNAHQTSCCGNTVCLQCANKWKRTSNSCPQCRKKPLEIIADPKTQRRITGATAYCPNYHFDCNWVGGFGRVTQHLDDDCEFEGKECPHLQCNNIVPKKFLKYHTSKLCLSRPVACPCCGKERATTFSFFRSFFSSTLTYHDIITDHHHKCYDWPARCPNSCDPYLTLTRSTVDTHVAKECPETLVDCKFAEVGCQVRRKRKDMPGHVKDALSDHMTAMFEELMKLKHENEELKRELKQSQTRKK